MLKDYVRTKVSLKDAKIRATPKTSSPGEWICKRSSRAIGHRAHLRGLGDQVICFRWQRALPSSWEAYCRFEVDCLRGVTESGAEVKVARWRSQACEMLA